MEETEVLEDPVELDEIDVIEDVNELEVIESLDETERLELDELISAELEPDELKLDELEVGDTPEELNVEVLELMNLDRCAGVVFVGEPELHVLAEVACIGDGGARQQNREDRHRDHFL